MTYEDPTSPSLDNLLDESPPEPIDVAADEAANYGGGDATAGAAEGPPTLTPTPAPTPLSAAVIRRTVSGRYRHPSTAGFQLALRVDVDRSHPLRKLSGDFYSVSGATINYFGSFIVDSPVVTTTASTVVVRGLGRFTWGAGAPIVQVTIPRRQIFQPAAPATLQFYTASGSPGANYVCQFDSPYFRSVHIETDLVSDVATPVFSSYNTGALPSGGPARTLSVVSAYAEAGIQMMPTTGADLIDISEAAANGDPRWSNAEMHASMVRHFSLFRDIPQWAVWQVVCQRHELGNGLLGIMFDQAGPQRQGCAVFHAGLGGTTPDKLREQLYCYVHELGHCFNLLHSWQKSLATPPGVDRPNALSFMNYPWRYPGGDAAFWAAFGFVFDDPELAHLRHAFHNDIILGGNPFATGSALSNPEIMGDPISDQSGLAFEIAGAHDSFALGEPVVIQLKLTPSDLRGKTVHPHLHPNMSMSSVVIGQPNGKVVLYEPYIDHLMSSQTAFLAAGEAIEDSAYIGFGRGGLYFEQPGNYTLRAVYHALDGSRVLSNVLSLRVRYPGSSENEELANLLLGEQQGALFFLLGSDSESLREGNAAFDTLLDRYGDHQLADYVRLAKGSNAGRTFKTISKERDSRMEVRPARLAEAQALLAAATAPASRVDDLSKMQSLEKLATVQRIGGDDGAANATLELARDAARTRARK